MEFKTIKETREKLLSKQISITELNQVFIDRIKDKKNINAFIFIDEDLILNRCKKLENLKDDLTLKGIPLGIKDLFCTIGMPTTAGSKILSNFDKFPQELVSLNVRSPQTVIMDRDVRTEVFKLEQKLGNKGRVLLRPSGTEPVIRIMVEATSKSLAKELANQLAELIKKAA